ncbi:unnamed protein product [Dibothriocephalus latus]|uniref:Uncharacterized protein n=1 Tax=Dibothriocephalus latus TaxID=60516 RepID=A0A3P7M457_DIBLA|nr:unnamed protein product [Dibothriocephalus latus]
MEMVQLSGLTGVDGPRLRSLQEYRKDVDLARPQIHGQLDVMAVPNGGLKGAKGLVGFGDPAGNLVVFSGIA